MIVWNKNIFVNKKEKIFQMRKHEELLSQKDKLMCTKTEANFYRKKNNQEAFEQK